MWAAPYIVSYVARLFRGLGVVRKDTCTYINLSCVWSSGFCLGSSHEFIILGVCMYISIYAATAESLELS